MMIQNKNNRVSQIVTQELQSEHNTHKISQICKKMGRLIAKKNNLIGQQPQLINDQILIGNYTYASDYTFLKDNNVKLVVSCLQLKLTKYFEDIQYQKFDIKDKEEYNIKQHFTPFYQLLHNFKKNRKDSEKIFVHCFAGKSRSVAMVISYLMKSMKISFNQAQESVKKQYAVASINKGFSKSLQQYQTLIQKEQSQNTNLLEIQPKKQPIIDLLEEIAEPQKKESDNLLDLEEEDKEKISEEVKPLEQQVSFQSTQHSNLIEISHQEKQQIIKEIQTKNDELIPEIESIQKEKEVQKEQNQQKEQKEENEKKKEEDTKEQEKQQSENPKKKKKNKKKKR